MAQQPPRATLSLAELSRLNDLLESPEEDLDTSAGEDAQASSPERPMDDSGARLAVQNTDAVLWTLEISSIAIPEPPSLAGLLGARERAISRRRHP